VITNIHKVDEITQSPLRFQQLYHKLTYQYSAVLM